MNKKLKPSCSDTSTRNIPSPQKYDLIELLERVTPDNFHEEVDSNGPVGKEEW